VLYYRGIALERSGDWTRAEADFKKALEFDAEQAPVLNYLGYSWIDRGVNLREGEGMIRKAVELRPEDGFIVDSLGWAYFQTGRFSEAVVELEKAVSLEPADPTINEHLGDAYWKVGRRNEALFQWNRALRLEPEKGRISGIEAKLSCGLASDCKAPEKKGG
jgi:Flp pilus assembly protein TadD